MFYERFFPTFPAQNLAVLFKKVHKNPPSYIYAIPNQEPAPFLASELSEKKEEGVDVGYFILPKAGTARDFEKVIFSSKSNPKDIDLFRQLNENKRRKAGTILIVADHKKQSPYHIQPVYEEQVKTDKMLELISEEEAQIAYDNYNTLSKIAQSGDKFIGFTSGSGGIYAEELKKTLESISDLYKTQLVKTGNLQNPQFFTQRKVLFNKMDNLLKVPFSNQSAGIPDYTKLKNALNLSSKSLVHEWKKSGEFDPKFYAEKVGKVTKMAKYMKAGGYISIGFAGLDSANEIHHACKIGREEECTKATYTNVGKFAGGVGGGVGGGIIGAGICYALAAGTVGVGGLVCAIVLSGTLGYVGGEGGAIAGEKIGEKIYETSLD